MKLRKITSLTAGLAFLVMVLTSIVLYIVPQGRIAYWADWRLWGLSKEQWGNIHINTGILFLLALGLHIYYNWTPIMNYLKNRSKDLKIFTREFNGALALTLVCVLGTYFEIPPFSSILTVSESIKDRAAEKYGEPPYGHAELSSLKTFARKTGLDLDQSLAQIREAGFAVEDTGQTLADIAEKNHVPPQQIYLTMKPKAGESETRIIPAGKAVKLPGDPPPGTGNMTLADLSAQFNLNIKTLIRDLSKAGIQAGESLTLKKIAENNQTGPMDIYEQIKAAGQNQVTE
ncbi:DUF4405 domain-containing protein [Desulfospira joergensenii]|uniref:DUF4405 domain-containing protein n=1 Tax=Desulfospira joergensenii TaxID=53329 RepID=UPI0003B469D8|nr:DUF4405 domain-containing protein [Desulfospira joergensenii]